MDEGVPDCGTPYPVLPNMVRNFRYAAVGPMPLKVLTGTSG